jgi:hypothetical protein
MRTRTAHRRWIASILAMIVLATHLATAAYACPALRTQRPADAQAMAGMPCERMMADAAAADPDRPALCFKHCQDDASQQPPDALQTSTAPAPAFVLLFHLAPVILAVTDAPVWAAHRSHRERAPPAPHSILHCCFRI